MPKKIEPTILKGTRDFLPREMYGRNRAMAVIQQIFERFGYAPIETPIISPAETILGKYGEEGDRLTYHFKDAGNRDIALPYDLTVPFARYVASNWSDLPMPFKRYQIQRVWRAEKPQKGRLREFYQCDIDVVGSKSLLVEAEVLRVIVEVFEALGLKDFKIKINSRRLINQVLESFDLIKEEKLIVIRAIDKMDKIGEAGVRKELSSLGLDRVVDILKILAPAATNQKTLNDLAEFDTSELDELMGFAQGIGVKEGYLKIDPSLARGLDYYTGIILEVVGTESDIGTLCAGGRYDDLAGMFKINAPKSSNPELSGMGVAFGFERIMMILEERGLLEEPGLRSGVLVSVFNEDMLEESLGIYGQLLNAGVASEIYLQEDRLEKQLKFADKKNIPYVIVLGPEEKKDRKVILKDMASGKQEKLGLEEVLERFRAKN